MDQFGTTFKQKVNENTPVAGAAELRAKSGSGSLKGKNLSKKKVLEMLTP